MSHEKKQDESLRWLKTAQDDIENARILLDNNRFSASCFHSQQAGEKALKALHYKFGLDTWGHSLVKLLGGLKDLKNIGDRVTSLKKEAMTLDRFYIPTRYPDGLPEITPMDAFNDSDAKTAISYAQNFIELATQYISEQ